jgi:hypothetical protein
VLMLPIIPNRSPPLSLALTLLSLTHSLLHLSFLCSAPSLPPQAITKELNESKSFISQLRTECDSLSRTMKEKDRAIIQLRRELIDVDTQLDSERRKRAAMRAALEKNSLSHKKEPKGSPEKTPNSFRLSTRSPPPSPSPYKESRGGAGTTRDNPPPAQTPEAQSTPAGSSRVLSEDYYSTHMKTGLSESRTDQGSSTATRSGSAPHSRVIRSKFLESKQTVTSATSSATAASVSQLSSHRSSHHSGGHDVRSHRSTSRAAEGTLAESARGAVSSSGLHTIPIPSWEASSSSKGAKGLSGR